MMEPFKIGVSFILKNEPGKVMHRIVKRLDELVSEHHYIGLWALPNSFGISGSASYSCYQEVEEEFKKLGRLIKGRARVEAFYAGDNVSFTIGEKPKLKKGKLSKMAVKEYLDTPVHCPYCCQQNISADAMYIEEGGVVTQYIRCHVCNKGWTDVYRLVDIKED